MINWLELSAISDKYKFNDCNKVRISSGKSMVIAQTIFNHTIGHLIRTSYSRKQFDTCLNLLYRLNHQPLQTRVANVTI